MARHAAICSPAILLNCLARLRLRWSVASAPSVTVRWSWLEGPAGAKAASMARCHVRGASHLRLYIAATCAPAQPDSPGLQASDNDSDLSPRARTAANQRANGPS